MTPGWDPAGVRGIRWAVLALVTALAPAVEMIPDSVVPYQPVYLLAQPDLARGKFQVSLAIHLIRIPAAVEDPTAAGGLDLGYSQTSFWDLAGTSRPIEDRSYRPEAWYHQPLPGLLIEEVAIDLGVSHESNGLTGPSSRSFNAIFLRPEAVIPLARGWSLDGAPRLRAYVGDMSENPDLPRFRGHVDAEVAVNSPGGWRMAVAAHLGDRGDRATLQVDLTYPLSLWTDHGLRAYLDLQVFDGWGETLLDYDQHSRRGMIGLAFVR